MTNIRDDNGDCSKWGDTSAPRLQRCKAMPCPPFSIVSCRETKAIRFLTHNAESHFRLGSFNANTRYLSAEFNTGASDSSTRDRAQYSGPMCDKLIVP